VLSQRGRSLAGQVGRHVSSGIVMSCKDDRMEEGDAPMTETQKHSLPRWPLGLRKNLTGAWKSRDRAGLYQAFSIHISTEYDLDLSTMNKLELAMCTVGPDPRSQRTFNTAKYVVLFAARCEGQIRNFVYIVTYLFRIRISGALPYLDAHQYFFIFWNFCPLT
jgi:hypothetical protein